MDEFKLVKSKSRRKNRQNDDDVNNIEKYSSELFNKVEKCKSSLRSDDSDLYASKTIFTLKELFRNRFKSEKISLICYGNNTTFINIYELYERFLFELKKV